MPASIMRRTYQLAIAVAVAATASVAHSQFPTQQQQPIPGQPTLQQPIAGQPAGQQPGVAQPGGPQPGVPTAPLNLPARAMQAVQRGHVYTSQRWLASFYFEEKLQIPGSPIFTAGRIVQIQPGSPLQRIGLSVGDVVTRLDGTTVSKGKWPNQQGCFYMLPEFERHYGATKIRFIRRGSVRVEEVPVDLGPRCRPQPIPASLLP